MSAFDVSGLDPKDCVSVTPEIDFEAEQVQNFARQHCKGESEVEKSVSLYYAVRDLIKYDPYGIDLSIDGLKASKAIQIESGWCVSKAILLAALLRSEGIPAALGFADVKNHLSTQKLREAMGTDIFMWHGYTSIWLDGAWVKATPAFNIELCEKFRILPLEFNGREDSIYHPYDKDGREHMEYLRYRGEYRSTPLEEMRIDFEKYYPKLGSLIEGADFSNEAAEEN